MLGFSAAGAAALEEIDSFTDRLRATSAADRERPTRCEGWTVEALARHMAAVIWQQAEAFHRVRLRSTTAPSWLELGPEIVSIPDALVTARTHLVSGLTAVREGEDPDVPLPFLNLPAGFAVQLLLIEYGVHRNDLEWALGDARPLHPDVAGVQIELLPAWLPSAGLRIAPVGTGYRLVASSGTTSVVCRDEDWQLGAAPPETTCTITGDDSAVALFTLGRIGPDHPGLEVEDPAGIAKKFKTYFPGP